MDSDFTGGPGFLAFVVTFALVAAGVLLFRSLSKHLRKVRAKDAREAREADAAVTGEAEGPEPGSGDAEGGERGGDEVTGEPGDRQ
ncbi:hypothetical protein [Demequina mangrovi]|uniref:Uncharacterized protein n=1 Tax=Demequina mangrovi TaxID=1043493 RepID=A0A1H6YE39_9MICO|nr:hypothetical protein [Demequina mangrovi]SEJ35452.1 hypothetical protein SAMN05421637_1534 [Demequina mangrovi]